MSDVMLAPAPAAAPDASLAFPVARRRGLAVRAWHAYLAVGIAAIAAYYRLPKAGVGQAVLLTGLNATVVVASLRAAWRGRGWARVLWSTMALAMLASTVGNAFYFGNPLATHALLPFPSRVDALNLAVFPFLFLALGAQRMVHRGERRRGSLLDGGILAVGAGLVLWEAIVTPTAKVPLPTHFAHQVSVAYPMLDVVVLGLLAWFLAGARGRNASSTWLVLSYVAVIAGALEFSAQMADLKYAYGGPTDALWMLSYLLVGVAALHPSATVAPRPRATRMRGAGAVRIVLVAAAALVGPVLLLTGTTDTTVVGRATVAIAVFVVARVALTLRPVRAA